jgi:pectate lyase
MIKAAGVVDVVNNVILVPGTTAISVDGEYQRSPVNVVGNYVLAPASDGLVYGVQALGPKPVSLFVKDNLGPHREKAEQPDELFVKPGNQSRQHLVDSRHEVARVTTWSPEEAYNRVLVDAGCTRPLRDAVDERVIREVRERRSRTIHDPAEVGGWPDLPAGVPLADTDHDGMPDEWEMQHRLGVSDLKDGNSDLDGDGYTNLEEYLNGTDPQGTTAKTSP